MIKDDIKTISGTTDGLEVNIAKTVDNRNNECFNVTVKTLLVLYSNVLFIQLLKRLLLKKESDNEGGEKQWKSYF